MNQVSFSVYPQVSVGYVYRPIWGSSGFARTQSSQAPPTTAMGYDRGAHHGVLPGLSMAGCWFW